jgi:hypothetical protein
MNTEKISGYLKLIGAVIGIIIPIISVTGWFINSVKKDILNEFRDEAATIRVEFLRDVQERYDDVTFEIQKLQENHQPIPDYLRSKQKNLERRITALVEK